MFILLAKRCKIKGFLILPRHGIHSFLASDHAPQLKIIKKYGKSMEIHTKSMETKYGNGRERKYGKNDGMAVRRGRGGGRRGVTSVDAARPRAATTAARCRRFPARAYIFPWPWEMMENAFRIILIGKPHGQNVCVHFSGLCYGIERYRN